MILKVCVLFGIAILLAFLFSKKKEKFDAEPVAETAEPQKKKRNPAPRKAKK